MKKTLASAFAMMMFALMASAPVHADERDGLFRFDFKCEFRRDNTTTSPTDERQEFKADARVFAELRRMNNRDDDKSTSNLENLISVKFDDQLIVAESAVLNSGRKAVVITGVSGSPSIIVIRKNDISTEWMRYEAFLKFGDRRAIEGSCEVRAERVDHDHAQLN